MTLATALPTGRVFFQDANGVPLVGGSIYFYYPGTTTLKNTWKDANFNTLNTNPVILDQLGSALIYGSGQYRQIAKNSDGITVWDATSNTNENIDLGFYSFIETPPTPPAVPIVGFTVTLPGGNAVVNGVSVFFNQMSVTLSANTTTNYWLNSDGSFTVDTQPTNNYTALLHYPDKLHIWQIATDSGNITSIILFGTTYPTVYKPNDIAGTIDTYAEIFYLNTTTTNWSSGLAVNYGELLVTSAGNVYQVSVPGTTGLVAPSGQPTTPITDGTATLFYYCQSSYLGMFREAENGGTEYYFTNVGLEQVCHKTLITGSPLGAAAGTTMASLIKGHIQGVFKHLILNRVNSGTYLFQMKMIAGGYIWLNTTVAGGTAAGSSPFSGSYTPGVSTVVDGTITWLCIAVSYASQFAFWMDVDRTFLTYRSPDSNDSYASTFASLLSRYIQLTGDYSWLNGASVQPNGSASYWSYYVLFDTIISQNLDQQLSNFLTQTFQYNINPADGSSFTIQYLEDNCESVKGYREAAYVYGVLGQTARQSACISNAAYVGSGVAALYNGTYNLFATHFGEDVSTWANNPDIGWYPYLQAQFFPELCAVATINDDQFKLVRYNVSLRWTNYYNDKALDAFPDTFIGFLAAKSWQDTEKAYDSIEKMERYYINGGTVAQGAYTLAGAVVISDWGYYLATKDALVAPLTLLNITGNNNNLNFLNQTGDIVTFTNINASASVYLAAANQAVTDSTFTALTFDTTILNDLGMWVVGNPTRLTVPAGKSRARITGSLRFEAAVTASDFSYTLTVQKNGSPFPGNPNDQVIAGTCNLIRALNVTSGWLPVSPGDYFELLAYQNSGATLHTDAANTGAKESTWFAIEVI